MQKTKSFYGYILNDLTTFIWVTPIESSEKLPYFCPVSLIRIF